MDVTAPLTEEWFNQNWIQALVTLIVGFVGSYILLSQLASLNKKNEFDILESVSIKMRRRFESAILAFDNPPALSRFVALKALLGFPLELSPSIFRPAGAQAFYDLRNRVRLTLSTMPQEVRIARTERDYIENLVARMRVVERLDPGQRQSDMAIITAYVNAVNDVAELVEEGMLEVGLFLGKYHINLVREVFIAEPYIYYINLNENIGRWGMRVLRLGAMAREFNDISPIQRKAIFFRDDEAYGPIYVEPTGRLLILRKAIWLLRTTLAQYPALSSHSKRSQQRFVGKLRRRLAEQ